MKIAFFGDVVGQPGRRGIQEAIPVLRERFQPDFFFANAENSAGGSGITASTLSKLISYGLAGLSSGDHIYRNKDFVGVIEDSRLVRPANYPAQALGRGWRLFPSPSGPPVAVINLLGRIFMEPLASCPFEAIERILPEVAAEAKVILLDMHAEATSEKIAMGWHLDGRVTAVLGTHTHIQTADERILPRGTAFISDLGMTGPYDSVLGRKKEAVLKRLITAMPARFDVAEGDIRACGVMLTIQEETGKAIAIERFQIPVAPLATQDQKGQAKEEG